MDFHKILNKISQKELSVDEVNNCWYFFNDTILREESKNYSEKNKALIKRIFDNFVMFYTQNLKIISQNTQEWFQKQIDIILTNQDQENKLNLINNGTIALIMEFYLKCNVVSKSQYFYCLVNKHTEIKKKVYGKMIKTLDKCNQLIEIHDNKNHHLHELIMNYEVYFHSIYAQLNFLEYDFGITNEEFNYLLSVLEKHKKICNISLHYSLHYFIKTYCLEKYWFLHINSENICRKSDKYSVEQITINNDIVLPHTINHTCPNCNQKVLINYVPLKFKTDLKKFIFDGLSSNQFKFIGKMKKMLKYEKPVRATIYEEDPIFVFDGANIGHFKDTQISLNFSRIYATVSHSIFHNYPKYMVLNEKHKTTMTQKEKEDFANIQDLCIIYTPKGIDDDLISIYLWLSKQNSFIITNDKFTKHAHKFQENAHLRMCWEHIEYFQKRNYIINNNKVKFISVNSKNKNKNKNVKSNHISDNLFVNYQITNKYIHFPVLNKEENENSKNEIVVYNTNNLLYGCKKMS